MQIEADQLERLDVKDLGKNNLLHAQNDSKIAFQDGLVANLHIYAHPVYGRAYLSFLNEGIKEEHGDTQIDFYTTECNFGGLRYWFKCPGTASHFCGNRVRTLYRLGYEFACRKCLDLTYSSKRIPEDVYDVIAKEIRMFHKLEEYKKSLKRTRYAGKPTKAFIRLNNYYEKYKQVKELSDSLIAIKLKMRG